MQQKAQAGAPKLTGALAASIDLQMEDGPAFTVNVAERYWKYQEFGTRKMSAHSFMRPAASAAAG